MLFRPEKWFFEKVQTAEPQQMAWHSFLGADMVPMLPGPEVHVHPAAPAAWTREGLSHRAPQVVSSLDLWWTYCWLFLFINSQSCVFNDSENYIYTYNMYICMYIYNYIYIFVCVYTYIYIYICMCIYIYIYMCVYMIYSSEYLETKLSFPWS